MPDPRRKIHLGRASCTPAIQNIPSNASANPTPSTGARMNSNRTPRGGLAYASPNITPSIAAAAGMASRRSPQSSRSRAALLIHAAAKTTHKKQKLVSVKPESPQCGEFCSGLPEERCWRHPVRTARQTCTARAGRPALSRGMPEESRLRRPSRKFSADLKPSAGLLPPVLSEFFG